MRNAAFCVLTAAILFMAASCDDGGSGGSEGSAGSGGTSAPEGYCSEFVEKYKDGSCVFEYEACKGSPTCSLDVYCERGVFKDKEEEEELCACNRSGESRRDAQGRGCNLVMRPGPSGGGFCDAIGRDDPATIRKMIEDFCYEGEKPPLK